MLNKKILKRAAAGIMSAALVWSYAGCIKPFTSSLTAAGEKTDEYNHVSFNAETGMYEYEFKDAYIYNVNAYKTIYLTCVYIDLIPYEGNSWFSYDNMKTIEIELENSAGDPEYEQYREQTYELAKKIKNESRIDIKFAAPELYEDMMEYRGYYGSSSDNTYNVSRILSVKDPFEHIYGDINDDGVIDSFDVVTYKQYIAGTLSYKLSESEFLNADIDLDTEITADDLRQVVDFTLGKAKEFNGTSNIGSIRLDNTVDVLASEGVETDKAFASAEMDFGVEVMKKCFDPEKPGEENLLISPLSISAALSMTANGADGETRKEMEKVLGGSLTIDDLNEYMAYYISNLPDNEKEKVYLSDSIWFRDDPTFKVYDEFLEKNKKFYNSEIYKSPFDDSIVKDVNSWVNKNTRGMIPTLITKANVPDNAMMMLINTLYFEADWSRPYLITREGEFTDLKGEKHPISKMNSQEYQYFDLGNADAFKKPYKGGEYSFVGILPHEDISIQDYIAGLDGKTLEEGLREYEDPDTVDLYVMIPKFKYNYSKSLKEILPAMGMEKAFSIAEADFSKINDLSVPGALPLYIDDVLHKTKIEVTEKGTKAAAATAVVMGAGAAAPIEKKEVYIELDRPFVYMIVDRNNVPLFIGAATQIEDK